MKKFAFFLSLSLLLSACGVNTPKGITARFLDCLVARDFEKAKMYATPETAKVIDFMKNMPHTEGDFIGYKILQEEITGNEAVVQCSMIGKDGKTDTQNINLVKTDGKWKVVMALNKK